VRTLRAFVAATHPIPAAAVTAIAGVLLAARHAEPRQLVLGILSTAAGQASVGWSNDYLDRDRDRRARREDKPLAAGDISDRSLRDAAVLALILCVAAGLAIGVAAAAAMAAAVAGAWAYNLGLKATWLSWAPYASSFALLTIFVGAVTDELPRPWIPAGAATLGVAAHLMNAVPDLELDRGMRGLPHRLGARGSVALAATLLGLGLVLAVVATRAWERAPSTAAGVVAAVLVAACITAAARSRPRTGFNLAIAAAAGVVAVVVTSPGRW